MSTSVLYNVGTHKEVTRDIVEKLFAEGIDETVGMIPQANNVTGVTRHLYRFAMQTVPASQIAKYSADGGVHPLGTGPRHLSFTAAFFWIMSSIRLTDEQTKLSQTSDQAMVNIMSTARADQAEAFLDMLNTALFTNGTGLLTNSATAEGNSTLTFDDATDVIGINKLREGMAVEVWDAAATTKRAAADTSLPLFITAIDPTTKVVTLNQVVTALAADDRLAFSGMDVYGPSTLVTAQSTWPVAPESQSGGGIGGDSFVHGFGYVNDDTDGNYYLGRIKSGTPKLKAVHVAAGGNALDFTHGARVRNKLQRMWKDDGVENTWLIFSLAQREQLFRIGTQITSKLMTGPTFGPSLDLRPQNAKYGDQFMYCDFKCRVDARQHNDRIDAMRPSDWGRVMAQGMETHRTPDGREWFEVRNGDGRVMSAYERYEKIGFDFCNYNPGRQAFIDGLLVPADAE